MAEDQDMAQVNNEDQENVGPQGPQGLQAGPVELNVQQRYAHALKAMSRVPTYDGTFAYRNYEPSFAYYASLNFFETLPLPQRKMILLSAMRGDAQTKTRNLSPGRPAFDNAATFEEFALTVYQVFAPPAESELARSEFASRSQGRREDISSYLSEKFSLYDSGFHVDEQNFYVLLQETIKGIFNPVIKRMVRRANPQNQHELRTIAIQAVAFEREAYEAGYAESQSLDGLEASTIIRNYQMGRGEEPMQLGKISEQRCYSCNKPGHYQRDCYRKQRGFNQNKTNQNYTRKEQSNGGQDKKQKQCYQCGKNGHFKADCKVPQSKWLKKEENKRGNFKGNSRGGRSSGRGGRQFTKQTLEEGEEGKEENEGCQDDEYSDHFLDKMLAEQNM